MAETCANPLLLQWLKEWMEQARERNTKGFTTYKKAHDSMKACPLRFNHPLEAQQLHGLGPKLCQRLTEKLEEHCKNNGLPMPEKPYRGSKRQSDEDNPDAQPGQKQRKKAPKQYSPTLRSGAWALLLALLTLDEDAAAGLTKDDLIEIAQPNCDSNFRTPSEPGKFYTAWNSMKTLLSKDLVHEHGRPVKRYMLTDEGREIALKLQRVQVSTDGNIKVAAQPESRPERTSNNANSSSSGFRIPVDDFEVDLTVDDLEPNPPGDMAENIPAVREKDSTNDTTSIDHVNFTPIRIPPGAFEVKLILDNREVRSTTDRDYISQELAKRGVSAITRALPVGDALWIAKVHNPPPELLRSGEEGSGRDEIVLDHIVERKRLDDLIGSIKDGRFHEQKFRLRRSGVKNVTYLVENITISDDRNLKYAEAVASAIASTQVVNDFFVKRTEKLDDTIRYLARMTKVLQGSYETEPLYVIPSRILRPQSYLSLLDHLRKTNLQQNHYISFAAFSSLTSKSGELTLRDVFLKMLMCCRGVTGEKAIEIQKRWKTPKEFFDAFERIQDPRKRNTMVSDQLQTSVPRKKIGKQLSTKIAEVWSVT